MRHLVRAGIVLAIFLTNLLALRYFAATSASTQSVLVQYDLVLSGTNEEATTRQWASQAIKYVGPSDCGRCHPDEFTQWGTSKHHVVSCEDCHGPAQPHLETGAELAVVTSRELCETCHGKLPSKRGDFPQVVSQQHAMEGWTCVRCHNPRHPERVLQAQAGGATASAVAHSLEGRDDCLSCHGSGGDVAFPDDHAGRTNKLCLGCHPPLTTPPAASQTPILAALITSFPRIPHRLEGRSNCVLCHNPDGLIRVPDDHTGRTNDMCRTCHKAK